jgi:hypothetical protein
MAILINLLALTVLPRHCEEQRDEAIHSFFTW